jgi:hypothetical protein
MGLFQDFKVALANPKNRESIPLSKSVNYEAMMIEIPVLFPESAKRIIGK